MRNYWIEYSEKDTCTLDGMMSKNFDPFVAEHMCQYPPSEQLANSFYTMASVLIAKYGNSIVRSMDRDDLEQELVAIAYEKLKKYDPEKGHAFNYFTTVIVSRMREIAHAKKKIAETDAFRRKLLAKKLKEESERRNNPN